MQQHNYNIILPGANQAHKWRLSLNILRRAIALGNTVVFSNALDVLLRL